MKLWDPYAQFEKTVLPNGLSLYVAHWPKRPWQVVAFLFHSGFECDPIGKEGLCHFTEHCVSESTSLSPKQIDHFFTKHGGGVNLGFTSFAQTFYRFFIPKKKKVLTKALDIFGSMLFEGDMRRAKIEREREVILGEWRKQYPLDVIYEMKIREAKMILKNIWLERFPDALGSVEAIKKISTDDLQNFYDTHFTPANLSVVSVGGWNMEQLSDAFLQSPFAKMKAGARALLHRPISDIESPRENRWEMNLSDYIQGSSPIYVGQYRTVVVLSKEYSPRVLQILRRMFSERLFEEIRDQRGLAYDVEVFYQNYRDFYIFGIECNGLVYESVFKVEEIVETTLNALKKNEKLFEKTKKHILAQQRMIDVDAHQLCDNTVDDLVFLHRILTNEEYYKEIEAVTFEDILKVLPALMPHRRWTVLVKPAKR